MKILLVEDEYDLAEMYRLQLGRGGHEVVWAESAQTAIDLLDEHSVDAILLDMLLPRNNGISLLHELRSYGDLRKLPVIIFSNVKPQELGITQQQLREFGVVNYLVKSRTKPLDLLAAVKELESSSS